MVEVSLEQRLITIIIDNEHRIEGSLHTFVQWLIVEYWISVDTVNTMD